MICGACCTLEKLPQVTALTDHIKYLKKQLSNREDITRGRSICQHGQSQVSQDKRRVFNCFLCSYFLILTKLVPG